MKPVVSAMLTIAFGTAAALGAYTLRQHLEITEQNRAAAAEKERTEAYHRVCANKNLAVMFSCPDNKK